MTISLLDQLPQDTLLLIARFGDTIPEALHHSTLEQFFSVKYPMYDVHWLSLLHRCRLMLRPGDYWYDIVSFYYTYCNDIKIVKTSSDLPGDLPWDVLSVVVTDPSIDDQQSIILSLKGRCSVIPDLPRGLYELHRTESYILLGSYPGMGRVLDLKIRDNRPFTRAEDVREIPTESISCQSFIEYMIREDLHIEIELIYSEFKRRASMLEGYLRHPQSLEVMMYHLVDYDHLVRMCMYGAIEEEDTFQIDVWDSWTNYDITELERVHRNVVWYDNLIVVRGSVEGLRDHLLILNNLAQNVY
uniref:Uncharacterized protein n=1 Tax=viral metagenome TaxID=1070528 RepID=A0A6C0BMJ9_9ZZZZ